MYPGDGRLKKAVVTEHKWERAMHESALRLRSLTPSTSWYLISEHNSDTFGFFSIPPAHYLAPALGEQGAAEPLNQSFARCHMLLLLWPILGHQRASARLIEPHARGQHGSEAA